MPRTSIAATGTSVLLGATFLVAALAPSTAQAQETGETQVTVIRPDGTETTTTVQMASAPPAPAPAPESEYQRLTERTAFMVGNHRLKIGILAFEYGITKRFSIGTDPPAWALRAWVDVLIPNLHFKVQVLDRDPVWVAVQVAGYYGFLKGDRTSGHLLDIPLTAYASVKVHPRVYLHGEGAYVFARMLGTGDLTKAEINGAGAVQAVQTGLMAQFKLTQVFSVIATGRLQVWTGDVAFNGSSNPDPFTSASVEGQLVSPVQNPWQLTGGFAALWKHFHLVLGAGYGYYFVPGMDIPNVRRTFVPDASIAVLL